MSTVQQLLQLNDDFVVEFGSGLRTVEISRSAFAQLVKDIFSDRRLQFLHKDQSEILKEKSILLTSAGGTFTVFYKEPDQDSNPWVTTPHVWK